MRISVVIPCYNCAGTIGRTLESIFRQSRPPDELVTVDDGSTDDTLKILKQFSGRITVESRPNSGVSATRNRGVELAGCEWIAFCDSDDLWHPAKLEIMARAAEEIPGAEFIFGPLFRKVALSRFSRTFATLIKSGVPILGALEIVSDTAGNRIISEVVDNAKENVRQGHTLAEPLMESKVFPPMVTRMVQIGEKSGSLEQLLEKISDFYDDQVSAAVKTLTSMIEPIMIGIMGFLVGGIVLAVFLPIFELQKQLGAGG